MVYNPWNIDGFFRHYTPGYGRLSTPKGIGDTTSFEQLRQHKYEIAKTKSEIVQEYYHVMGFVFERIVKASLALLVAAYFFMQLLASGGSFNLFACMVAFAWAMFKWWHGGAAYSNWQELEMRPLLMPTENLATENDSPSSGH
ncbi:MAG: hypothetical protein V1787_04960 [Candidatus Micrarchaeota archaeon]